MAFVELNSAAIRKMLGPENFYKNGCLVYTKHNTALILHIRESKVEWLKYTRLAEELNSGKELRICLKQNNIRDLQMTRFILFSAISLTLASCSPNTAEHNSLKGVIYRNANEVPQFKNFTEIGGALIDNGEGAVGESEFAISHITDSIRHILILEKLVRENNNPQSKYQVLDTINIGSVKQSEYITYCNCYSDTVFDPEIIAWVIADGAAEYYDRIIKAWRADTETGEITLIKDTRGIKCTNECYGMEGDLEVEH
ncbi:MAG TPA: hypothetical protein VI731_06360 [Bacteroidia bacterium]|nr:hypothetical protein [Bacteroidia bacterium]